MGIDRISGYQNFYDNYQIKPLHTETIKPEETPEQQKPLENITHNVEPALVIEERRPNISLEDVSLTYNPGIESELVGRDSDIKSLDVQQAISDMKKDSILEEYQYFVGSGFNMAQQSADGIVVIK